MLNTMRQIIQEINATDDFNTIQSIIVKRIKEAIETQAVSVFLMDRHTNELVLMATNGLNRDLERKLRVDPTKGLIGLVVQREEPINIDDAPSHPKFFRVPEVGEESFRAFLGVPIIHHRRMLGILLAQQEEKRRFDEDEEAFLVTMSAQLASILAHAEATGEITSEQPKKNSTGCFLEGLPAVTGVAIGTSVVVYPPAELESVPDKQVKDAKKDLKLFDEALEATKADISMLRDRMNETLPAEEHSIFDAYLKILDSSSLRSEVKKNIDKGLWAQAALRDAVKLYIAKFSHMDDPYLRERATDIKDLGRRVLAHLQEQVRPLTEYPNNTILVGEEVTATVLAEVPTDKLAGVISASGSAVSHIAILARALEIPTVMGVNTLPAAQLEGREIIVNGYDGKVIISPTDTIKSEFIRLAKEEKELNASLERLRNTPAQTQDDHNISLLVNAGLMADVERSLIAGADGIGLYRTEIPFMIRERFPSEKEQYTIYRQVLKAFHPMPVNMRTLDIGGDKVLPYFPFTEANPFLGWRGLRVTLDHPEIFLLQARAMLRANEGLNNLRIMLPMVTSVDEIDEALRLLRQAYKEVKDEGADAPWPQIGAMVEVPAAVYQIKAMASQIDFFSVGSNDLLQYLLAVDRNNARVAHLYEMLHPASIAIIHQAARLAEEADRPISICGEMTGDPAGVLLLMAMGFDSLSMNASSILKMKWVIQSFSMEESKKMLEKVLRMDNAIAIREYLEAAIVKVGLGGLIRPGKK